MKNMLKRMPRVMTSLLMSSRQSAFCIDFFDADNQIPEKLQAVFPFATLPPERPRELAHRLLLTDQLSCY